jgi:hypothetical protein
VLTGVPDEKDVEPTLLETTADEATDEALKVPTERDDHTTAPKAAKLTFPTAVDALLADPCPLNVVVPRA